jgi:hypothetical protein
VFPGSKKRSIPGDYHQKPENEVDWVHRKEWKEKIAEKKAYEEKECPPEKNRI